MASIFTYEPDPPRVASPWLQAIDAARAADMNGGDDSNRENTSSPGMTDAGCRITRLQAEPQEGPVEYKLHLLLRPRRKFRSTSTATQISGSRHSQIAGSVSNHSVLIERLNGQASASLVLPAGITQQTRQHRLEQLTTQLLWRLQQSSPHHSSSASNIILPTLPEALPELQAPLQPAKLLQGLEESQGALYEIGVSDDGTLVGLAEDEMQESLNNLRAMAACLGCVIDVLRKETVGWCEWTDGDTVDDSGLPRIRRTGKLVVAEAFVRPLLSKKSIIPNDGDGILADMSVPSLSAQSSMISEQLRITFTGPTMSGKSTLLGTLTTSTLDNGRGKSRLSMLKHRHEITTGITSSVTQELLGYQDAEDGTVDVINYARENIASWIDVHNAAAGSRLVFISDSAGHPKYRRTTVRSLVGWAPHWTVLCVSADDSEEAAARTGTLLGSSSNASIPMSDMDLSAAQLQLCLRLRLPLVIAITKLDLASRSGLRQTLTKVLDALKAVGRKPAIVANSPGSVTEECLSSIPAEGIETAYKTVLPLLNDPIAIVPIILTSAVEGTGIRTLHALLHELPLPDRMQVHSINGNKIFHVEDIYSKPAESSGVIVSGHLRSGQISVGDVVTLGPFSIHELNDDSEDSDERPSFRRGSGHLLPASRSFPGALPHLRPPSYRLPNQEWKRVRVTSIRNLRLPVLTLGAGQVGTLGIMPDTAISDGEANLSRIRKGMVLVPIQPSASRMFVASFQSQDADNMAVGSHVMLYSASVRASARVLSVRKPGPETEKCSDEQVFGDDSDRDNTFPLDDVPPARMAYKSNGNINTNLNGIDSTHLQVTFRLESSKEYLIAGDPVLVMPGGGPGLYGSNERGERGVGGLDGFVGRIDELIP